MARGARRGACAQVVLRYPSPVLINNSVAQHS